MTDKRRERNRKIKAQVKRHLDNGLLLKTAIFYVSQDVTWGLSERHIERIYFETPEAEKQL
jgi:hypothetical protein